MRNVLLFCLLITAISCTESNVKERDSSVGHFSVTRLLKEQSRLLAAKSATLHKTVFLDGKAETKDISASTLDSSDWKKELQFLHEAEIDLPAYRGIYEIDSSGSTVEYRLKEGEDGPVKYLKVVYENGEPKHVEADMLTANILYRTGRYIRLNFELNYQNDALLTSYSTTGFQKLAMRDSTTFKVRTEIR